MGFIGDRDTLPFKTRNKEKRSKHHLKIKKAKESAKRDFRLKRRRDEEKNPHLREERHAKNIPITIDHKRVWDNVDDEQADALGLSVDIQRLKKQKTSHETDGSHPGGVLTETNLRKAEMEVGEAEAQDEAQSSEDDDLGSLLDSDAEDEEEASPRDDQDGDELASEGDIEHIPPEEQPRALSPAPSGTSTNLALIPDALAAKFPSLFQTSETPKILITGQLGGVCHEEAEVLTQFFPNSHYVRRQRHRYRSNHFSLREIAKFANNRSYTAVIVLNEDHKRPSGLTMIHLPVGPTFHFSISNWVEGKKLPGHGNPTEHFPELILNNFRTPLGLLTAHLFQTMFPPQPEIIGRQVVTLHNQRDYIFVRRHRYIFRNKREKEKAAAGSDGKPMKGVEDIKAGLQELGPRFTLKLRRIDKGIQRASGQEWEWKAGMEKQRTKFNL